MQICNGIIQFNRAENYNFLGRILYEINIVDIKKHAKTLLELNFKKFWVKNKKLIKLGPELGLL